MKNTSNAIEIVRTLKTAMELTSDARQVAKIQFYDCQDAKMVMNRTHKR